MLDRILVLLTRREPVVSVEAHDELQLAAAALLVEAARMDDQFDESERRRIEDLLSARFALSPEATGQLLDAAERAVDQSTQLFRFTQTIAQKLSLAERTRIVEMLWEVAYADGTLAPQEDALIRRIAGLVYVPDGERTAARRRVRQRLGLVD